MGDRHRPSVSGTGSIWMEMVDRENLGGGDIRLKWNLDGLGTSKGARSARPEAISAENSVDTR